MKYTIKFGVIALSMILFVMAFTAIPVAKAEEAHECVTVAADAWPVPKKSGYVHLWAANQVVCPHCVKWAALWVEIWMNGVHIPAVDTQSPFDGEIYVPTNNYQFSAWATWQCNPCNLCPH